MDGFLIVVCTVVVIYALSMYRKGVESQKKEDKGWVNGVPPCPPTEGYLHEWVYDGDKLKDLVCAKCNKTPSQVSESL